MVPTLIAVLGLVVQQPCDSVLAIWNVSVVPMDSARVLSPQTVLVRDGRIAAITPAGTRPAQPCWTVVDGTGKYLLPGLADMHVHTRDTADFVLWLAKASGDTAAAIVAYRKSVENDERMMDAIDRLKHLGAWPAR